jgi:hypothetical protein
LGWFGGLMDDFKSKISEEVIDSLTMEDLWKSPRLKKYHDPPK